MIINGQEIIIPERGFSCDELAGLLNVKPNTVRVFAAKYNVSYNGEGYRKNYHFFEQDIIRFISRPKPGRRWH